jgi:hypothetical protein
MSERSPNSAAGESSAGAHATAGIGPYSPARRPNPYQRPFLESCRANPARGLSPYAVDGPVPSTQCGAGFILPGEGGRNLPPAIEGAVVALVSDYWASRGRDPTLRAETMIERQFWVGAVGDPAMLPPRVLASIAPFRRPAVAVA